MSKIDLNNYEEIKKCLTDLGLTIFEDPNLVRGLDYYCHTVFEFKTNQLGSQNTLIGGGRYDGLIKTLGGKDLPGVGWAGGIERIMLLMKNIIPAEKDVHLAIQEPTFKKNALKIYDVLIKNNFNVYWNYKYNLKKSLSIASEKNAEYIVIIGEKENMNNNFSVKNLSTGEQKILDLNNIIDYLK